MLAQRLLSHPPVLCARDRGRPTSAPHAHTRTHTRAWRRVLTDNSSYTFWRRVLTDFSTCTPFGVTHRPTPAHTRPLASRVDRHQRIHALWRRISTDIIAYTPFWRHTSTDISACTPFGVIYRPPSAHTRSLWRTSTDISAYTPFGGAHRPAAAQHLGALLQHSHARVLARRRRRCDATRVHRVGNERLGVGASRTTPTHLVLLLLLLLLLLINTKRSTNSRQHRCGGGSRISRGGHVVAHRSGR